MPPVISIRNIAVKGHETNHLKSLPFPTNVKLLTGNLVSPVRFINLEKETNVRSRNREAKFPPFPCLKYFLLQNFHHSKSYKYQ
jgi:hypothetical protein